LILVHHYEISIFILGSIKEEEIRTLGRGDYFGEQALIKEDKRTANIIALSPGVECLTLDRESFNQHIGDLIELHQRDYGDRDRIYAIKNLKNKQIPIIERSDFLKGLLYSVSYFILELLLLSWL
jgi:CRP-like cAMP-binding protein